jgi:hypothetical protein
VVVVATSGRRVGDSNGRRKPMGRAEADSRRTAHRLPTGCLRANRSHGSVAVPRRRTGPHWARAPLTSCPQAPSFAPLAPLARRALCALSQHPSGQRTRLR